MTDPTAVRMEVHPITAERLTGIARMSARHGVRIDDYRDHEDGSRSARLTFSAALTEAQVQELVDMLPD